MKTKKTLLIALFSFLFINIHAQTTLSANGQKYIDNFMKLLKDNPGTIRLNPTMPNVLFIKLGKIGLKEKSEFIREKLDKLL